jgi:hypothetical protein
MYAVLAPLVLPQFDALLIGLLVISGLIVAVGIIYILHGFTRAVVGGIAKLISSIPGVGSIFGSPVNAVYHWLNAEFSAAEAGLDRRISNYFHQLAKLVKWVGSEIEAHANLLYALSTILLGSSLTAAIRAAIALLHTKVAGVSGRITNLYRSIVRPISARITRLERWTYPRVKALDHAIDVTIPRDVAGLRSRAKTIEGELSKAWDAIRKNEAALAATAMVGVVALALAKLDLGWLRCRNTRNVGKAICGVNGSELDSLLGLLVGGAALLEFRELVKLAQSVEHGVAAGLQAVAKP